MYKLTIDVFREAAERFAAVEAGVLPNWHSACNCPTPGTRIECRSCPYDKKLVLLIQEQLDPLSDSGLAVIRPPEHEDPYSDRVKQQCIEMYAQGYSFREIQQLNGVPQLRILRGWLRESGLPGRSAKHSKDKKQVCIQRYIDGLTPTQIENETGVPADTITDWVYSAGVARRSKFPSEVKQKCIELYQEGKTAKVVSQITGVHPNTIKSWIANLGLSIKQKRYSQATIDKCLRLYREGNSPKEINALTGILEVTIRSWTRQAGLSRESQSLGVNEHLSHGDPSLGARLSYERKPIGYWQDFDNLKREIIALNEKRGQFGIMPTVRELGELERGDLKKAISRYHGGYQSVAEKLGLDYVKKRHGYWFDFSNVEHDLRGCLKSFRESPFTPIA